MAWKKLLWSDDAVVVRKNSGADIGTRPRLNFIEGSNITLAISDDAVGDEIDISIAATQYSHPAAPACQAATSALNGHATSTQIAKLAGIDTGAKDDQTGAEIKTAYEAEADTNAYDDAAVSKLAGIDTGADVTGSNPPQAHGASVHTDRTRTFIVAAHHHTTGGEITTGVNLDPDAVENVSYRFALPKDFVSLTSVKVLWMTNSFDATDKNWVLDLAIKFGTVGQLWASHNNTDLDNVIAISAYDMYTQKTFTITAAAFTDIVQSDIVLIKVERDADHASDTVTYDIIIGGLIIEYTADM